MKDVNARPLQVESPGIGIEERQSLADYMKEVERRNNARPLSEDLRWIGWLAVGFLIGMCLIGLCGIYSG